MLRKKNKAKLIIIVTIIIIISGFFTCRFFIAANEIARAEATRFTTETVNKIANQYLSENSELYSNILVKDKSPSGNISAINTDIEKINILQTEMSSAILGGLSSVDGIDVKIPSNEIIENGDFLVSDILVYPYFGSVKEDKIPGYIFVPDGVGALIRYNQWTGARRRFENKDIDLKLSEPQLFMQRRIEELLYETSRWILDSYGILQE